MKPINKLRERCDFLDGNLCDECSKKLHLIADEIEAEIADMQAFCERVEKAAENSDELDVFGVSYMALPVDADGVPIHVGDVMMDDKTPRCAVAVAPESFMMDGYETGSFYRPGIAKNFHHVKPRTLEDVLKTFFHDAFDADVFCTVRLDDVLAKYADEIRELFGGDA